MHISKRHFGKIAISGLILVALSSCSSVGYYYQAISGHVDLISRERPLDDVLNDPKTSDALKQKLQLAKQARQFASLQLLLPDNDSYKTYADLQRDSVVWNVIATPAYSVKAKNWCFLIVGCLSYRGYFEEQDAVELASRLKTDGLDVQVSGAWAYSTLGYFDDPLLNTMMGHSDASLIGIIFHELAHQVVYISGDTAFNEAFATAVEQEGLRRWFKQQDDEKKYQDYLQRKQAKHRFYELLKITRDKLNIAFEQDTTEQQKLTAKKTIYAQLKTDYKKWRVENNFYAYDRWMQRDLNNSHLALIATYQDLVPTFLSILASVDGDLTQFYKLVEELGELEKEQRQQRLASFISIEIGIK